MKKEKSLAIALVLREISGSVKIGVLGGIGPESTGEFYNKLISELQERGLIKNNSDFPQIIINSIPAPELIYNEHNDKDLRQYIEGLKELEIHKPDFIVMVCNTIHFFHERLQREVKTPIIDLRREVQEYLKNKKVETVVVLGSPISIKGGLYKFEDINYVEISGDDIEKLSESTYNFNRGFQRDRQVDRVREIARKYFKGESNSLIILGCTELALMLKDESLLKIDPMDILVDSAIRRISAKRASREVKI